MVLRFVNRIDMKQAKYDLINVLLSSRLIFLFCSFLLIITYRFLSSLLSQMDGKGPAAVILLNIWNILWGVFSLALDRY